MVKFQVKPFASLRSLDKDDVHLGGQSIARAARLRASSPNATTLA